MFLGTNQIAQPAALMMEPVVVAKGEKKVRTRMRRSLYPRHFGRRVRILREDLRMSQPDLIRAVTDRGAELTQSYLSKLENARPEAGFKAPSGEVVAALAGALQTSADFLLCMTDDPDAALNAKEEVHISPEGVKAGDIVDKLSPTSRREALQLLQTLYEVDAERRAANTRQWNRLLDIVGKTLGSDARSQIEQSILRDNLEIFPESNSSSQ